MNRMIVVCGVAVGLLTGIACGQTDGAPRKRNVYQGWIESAAHPVPGTAPAVIQADIAAGSGYVFVDDSTNKVMTASVMSSTANLSSHAGEHVGLIGVELPANGKSKFYIIQVVLNQKAIEQQAQQNALAQAKTKTEEEAKAKQKASDEALSKIPEWGPEETYRGWYTRDCFGCQSTFVVEGTNKKWPLDDEHYMLAHRNLLGKHMVITARLDHQTAADGNGGLYMVISLHLDSVVSISNDPMPSPASASPKK